MKLTLCAILLIINATAFSQSKAEQLLTEADHNLKSTRYDEALLKVEEVLKIEPSNLKALQMQIYICFLKEDLKQSYSLADKAVLNYPEENEFYYLRGLINNGRQKYKKAIEDFDKIISKYNSRELFKVYLNRGIANMNLFEYERAAEDFTRSIELNSDNASAYHSRGLLNYQLRDYNAAAEDFKKALEINPENAETNFNLGMSYFRLEELDNACVYFQKACKAGNLNACKMIMLECARNLPK